MSEGRAEGLAGDARDLAGGLAALEACVLRDPGGRGVAGFAVPGALARAAGALAGARRVGLVTGFPVRTPAGFRPETDGPPGSLALARALAARGAEVVHLTCPTCAPALQAIGAAPLEVCRLAPGAPDTPARAAALLERLALTHLVSIERPGRAADGTFRNMRGEDITPAVDALDELLLAAAARGVTVLAVGDGGNEAGLGALRERVAGAVPHGPAIATVVPADVAVVAGVSTWGAYGLVAGLSLAAGRDLLPTPAQVEAQLVALRAAGAVDGPTREPGLLIDGLPLADTWQVLADLRACLARAWTATARS